MRKEIQELRAILEIVQAKDKERVWLRNQTSGDLDESRLIESIVGEKNVYKKRGKAEFDPFQSKPKVLRMVFDLSASMARFNGVDGRLDRSLECALLIMEGM